MADIIRPCTKQQTIGGGPAVADELFDRQGIPEALLRSQGSSTANEQVSAVSVDDGFEDDTTLEMHSLVHLATCKWLESQG
ncbi:hypothetical protein BU25DRAFT_464239, partial [Macroventuria anomochaeta]